MKVYVAASWIARQAIRGVRDKLQASGITVTSRWLDWPPDGIHPLDEAKVSAQCDLEDIDKAHALLVCTDVPTSKGGFHTELGYALATNKPIVLLGPRASNFFYLPEVVQASSLDEAITMLKAIE